MASSKSSGPRCIGRTSRRLARGPRGGIELLLIQGVESLGDPGDVVEVKRGYAINYLLPQGLATVATDHHKRMVEKHKSRLLEIQKARLAGLRQIAEQVSHQSITIEANATDEGHLYGSVGPNEISGALKQNGLAISPDQIRLDGPLKELGLYTVKVHIAPQVDAELKVWVVPLVSEGEAANA